jgi:hypothetical protein
MRRDECQVSSDRWIETEKRLKRKITVFTLSALLLALCPPAQAQQPKKIHPEMAKQIGLTIPQSVLYRADKVIR